ncbi:nitrilase-related carbon-nitrogen hydrolase, partial [Halarchaeum acidiphilum]|uniref:nitrilase-related carbon-nitrogen hydrolase n=1 Tax=Halarchaeum acidiphilum TaxID=489138 RepID=UPI0005D17C95
MSDPAVAACQCAITDCDPAANVATVRARLAGLDDRVDVAIFPEYALTGFVADDRIADAALARARG